MTDSSSHEFKKDPDSPPPRPALMTTIGRLILSIISEVLADCLLLLKKPISLMLVCYILAVVFSYTTSYLLASIQTALRPTCSLPLVSLLDLPWCARVPTSNGSAASYPELIDLQTRFEAMMEGAAGGSSLALEIKGSEAAIRDLNTLVKISDLVSKETLSTSLDSFVASAKAASRNLQKLSSGVGGAVDAILAMDEFALNSLEAVERKRIEAKSHPLTSLLLLPFRGPAPSPRQKVFDTFIQSAAVMETNLRRLILEAEGSLVVLDQLESQLDIIHDIVSREEKEVKHQTDQVLALLWTVLGGNRAKLLNFNNHRALLSQISSYRSRALAHVSGTLIQLQQLSADLDDLRDRVSRPALLSDIAGDDVIPLEVHINIIKRGIERLNDGRVRAKVKEAEILRKMIGDSVNGPPSLVEAK